MNSETRNCQNCKKDFIIEPDDFGFYEKIKVPTPTFCPQCRIIRRYNFRNESMLFRRLDSHSGKEIFSGFPQGAKIITYDNPFWFSDNWDQLESGKEYDFSRPFFDQLKELLSCAPLPAKSTYNMVNSDYCNEMSCSKNCYLCFNSDYLENSGYLRKTNHCKDSFDIYEGFEDELSYESVMIDKCYKTLFSVDCESCVDVWFSKGLRGCTNCFGCVNLVNKAYHYFNEQFSKEEYLEKLKQFKSSSFGCVEGMKQKAFNFWQQFPVKYARNIRVTCSTGERIYDSKNVKDSYSVRGSENMRHCQDIIKASNSYDFSVWGDGAENVYECMTCGLGAYNIKFCFNSWEEVHNLEYCGYCFNTKNCFGCIGLRKKEYCILNKQYSKEEYEIMLPRIKKHMNEMPYVDNNGRAFSYGEFFPFDISPFAYSESLAQIFFPLNSDLAHSRGFIWREINRREYQATIDSLSLPDHIEEINDDFWKEIIKCKNCTNTYRITKLELQFYRRLSLPLPRLCHDCRFSDRFKFINPLKLWHRTCMCDKTTHDHADNCTNSFETPYAPDRPEIVYCEKCYQQEVY